MMTLAQWQNTRRVDHVHLPGGLNPRFRGNPGPGLQNLKGLDQYVQAYWNVNGQDDWAKVGALAQIAEEALAHIAAAQGQVEQRYITAVQALLNSATADLNMICGAYQANRNVDLAALHGNGALVQRTVRLNVFYLAPIGANPNVGPIDQVIDQHILNANQLACYQRAHITFQRVNGVATVASQTNGGGSILMPAVNEVPVNQQGKFADGGIGGRRLVEYSDNSGGGAGTIDVAYLDHYENAQDDVQGRAYRTNDTQIEPPNRPIVTITLNPPVGGAATYPTTLAHELGHAITGCPAHIQDGNNLMCGGFARNGTNNLSDGQIAWLRNNPWAN